MRLHRLELTAFGPFAGTQVVDFDALSEAGLFLLHGPTGAGKSSVLDAVCFALFGRVPGNRGAGALRVHSDHAPPDRGPHVRLELTVAGRRLEVDRTPEWQRPKLRGAGTTRAQATTTVRELVDGRWVPRTTRNDEAAHLLHGLLGMGAEQFTKVVMLPQGEFAAFLRSGAQERAQLLSRLFSIEVFAGVESWLAHERRELGREVEQVGRRTAELVSRADEAASGVVSSPVTGGTPDSGVSTSPDPGAPDPGSVTSPAARQGGASVAADPSPADLSPADPSPADPNPANLSTVDLNLEAVDPTERVRNLVQQVAEAFEASQVALTRCTDDLTLARRAWDEASTLADLQDAFLRAQQHQADLDLAVPAHDEDRRRLQDAVRAGGLRSLIEASDASDLVVARTEAAVLSATQQWEPFRGALGSAGSVVPVATDLRSRLTDLDGSHAVARAVAENAAVREGLRAEVLLRTRAAVDARTEREKGELQLAQVDAALGEVEAEVARHRDGPTDLDGAAKSLDRAKAAQRHADDLIDCRASLTLARERSSAAVDADLVAREHLVEVRERRLDGYAAELADELVTMAPCPVCGSCEHPRPATPSLQAVDDADERAAARHADQARIDREAAAAEVATWVARESELVALSGGLDGAAARQAVADARAGYERADAAHRGLTAALARRTELIARRGDLTASRAGLVAAEQDAATALAEAAARLDEMEAGLRQMLAEPDPDDLGGVELEELAGRTFARIVAERDAVRALIDAVTARDEAVNAALLHRGQVDSAAVDCGFADADAARSAMLAPELMARLTETVRLHETALAEVQATLSRADLQAAAALPTPDLDALALALKSAQADADRATAQHAVTRRSRSQLARLQRDLAEHETASAEVRARFARLDDLSRCVDGTGGGNSLHMRLASFVLAARLEQVAAAASERLDVMSAGRYALVHSDERAKGGGRSGLSLKVVDGWTGAERDTSTLSGGETFLASLSLALGLADVVQAEAGGASIETLFVDEGFGTLDEETLDEVMGVLDGLRDGGRAVGLVSHVAELRHRIPAQIEVLKARQGSTLVAHLT